MPQTISVDNTWSALSEVDQETRRREMEDRFARLTLLDGAERLDTAEAMLRAEFTLGESDLPAFTADRLQAWMSLDRRDPAQAAIAVAAYDSVVERLPANMAMRRASVVQAVTSRMTVDEVATLQRLIPSLKLSVPVALTGIDEQRALLEVARDRMAAKRQRPFWKIWG